MPQTMQSLEGALAAARHPASGLVAANPPMNGDARATKDASPTPTSMRQRTRVQKPRARPQPATASVQALRPMPISRNAFAYLDECEHSFHS